MVRLCRLLIAFATSFVFAVTLLSALPAAAEKRVALIIGNSAYRNVGQLINPANDAKLMADTLGRLGFTLIGGGPQLDLDKVGFDAAVQSFSAQLVGADVALFYYAGHGVQVRGSNYLVPVGANPTREADVFLQMVDIALVLSQMEGSGTRLNLVILDACRNNPFGGRGLRATESGLAQIRAPEGTLISFATQPGNVAADGTDGNSPYTKALAQTIRRPGLGIFDAVNEVGLAVKRATGGAQQPWFSTSPIDGSFFFAGLPAAKPEPPKAQPETRVQPLAAGEEFWLTIRDSRVSVLFEEFIRNFPASRHAAEARTRLKELKDNQSAAIVPPAPPPVVPPAVAKQELPATPKQTPLVQPTPKQTLVGQTGGGDKYVLPVGVGTNEFTQCLKSRTPPLFDGRDFTIKEVSSLYRTLTPFVRDDVMSNGYEECRSRLTR